MSRIFRESYEYDDRGRQTLHVSFEGVVARRSESLHEKTGGAAPAPSPSGAC